MSLILICNIVGADVDADEVCCEADFVLILIVVFDVLFLFLLSRYRAIHTHARVRFLFIRYLYSRILKE